MEELINLLEFIQQNYLILVVVLMTIGYAVKKTKTIPDKWIPLILIVLGGILGGLMGTQTELTLLDSILQGILCGGAAVGVHQVPKQIKKE